MLAVLFNCFSVPVLKCVSLEVSYRTIIGTGDRHYDCSQKAMDEERSCIIDSQFSMDRVDAG